MKTIQYFFFVAVATVLMAADCSNKDSEFYNDVFVTSPGLVTIERSDIPENQAVYVNASVPKLLNAANLTKPFDIYKTTGSASKLNFSYEVEQLVEGEWEYIEINVAQLQIIKGTAQVSSFVLGSAVYNSVNETYEYRVGLNLPAGTYRLSFGYNSNANNIVELRSESINNNLFLNLNSPNTTDLNNEGYYNFTII
jgi:hypothetical protein